MWLHSPRGPEERSRLRWIIFLGFSTHILRSSCSIGSWLAPVSWPQLASAAACAAPLLGSRALPGLILSLPLSWVLRQCPGEGTIPPAREGLRASDPRPAHCSPLFSNPSGDTCLRNPLHKQQSLPLRPIIPLVARISDQNASGAPPMTVREKTRLEKFRQLLSSHNTDLGEFPGALGEVGCGGGNSGQKLPPSSFFDFLAAPIWCRCRDAQVFR